MGALPTIPGITGVAFQRTRRNSQDICDMLKYILERVLRWRSLRIMLLLVLAVGRELQKVDEKFDQVENFFSTVSILGAMVSAHCSCCQLLQSQLTGVRSSVEIR